MRYCSQCGDPVESRIPPGDNRHRYVCPSCAAVHYENPLLVVGCVIEHAGQILLCKRAIEPRYGYWTVPAGFMELGETVAEAAARETWEEARARIEPGPLIAMVDVVHARQVHVFFASRLTAPEFAAGEETLEAALFPADQLPWDEIAFPSVRIALETWLARRPDASGATHIASAPRVRIS